MADQTFTRNPSAFFIAGTTVLAGGPAVIVDGTTISLLPSGTLLIGSSTIQLLPTAQITSSLSDIDINGVINLEASGKTLDIGTGRFALPRPTGAVANVSSNNIQAFTSGGQGKKGRLGSSFLSYFWLFAVSAGLLC